MEQRFGDWLRRQLVRRDLSQADLAKRMRASTGAVSQWVTGKRVPDPSSCERIADALNVDRDEVLALAGHREPDEPIEADDPRTDIIAKVKRVKWNEERIENITAVLDTWIGFDKRARGKEGASEH